MKIAMGLDPGIGNTGYAIVKRTSTGYELLDSGYRETSTKATLGDRLDIQHGLVCDRLMTYKPDILGIEAIFFNRNISSCISTAHVIGVAELAAFRLCIPALQVKPQDAKMAVGCIGNASKKHVRIMVNKVLRSYIRNQHECDAAAIAIAALLKGIA